MKDITPSYQGVASWNGQRLQYTFDGDRNYFKYILPPFGDAENQAKFKAEYGRDLAVPTTWEEYAEVATFFSGWDWDGDGELEYGSTEIVKRDDVAFANFITRVASYAKNPNVTGGFWFDLDTMTPQVNNPGFVKGSRCGWTRSATCRRAVSTLASATRSSLGRRPIADECHLGRRLHPGDAAGFADPQQDPRRYPVRPLHGLAQGVNRVSGQWDEFETPSVAPYVTWGWAPASPSTAKSRRWRSIGSASSRTTPTPTTTS